MEYYNDAVYGHVSISQVMNYVSMLTQKSTSVVQCMHLLNSCSVTKGLCSNHHPWQMIRTAENFTLTSACDVFLNMIV